MKRTINKKIKTVTILCFVLFFILLSHYHNKNSSIFFKNKAQENRYNKQLKNSPLEELRNITIVFFRLLFFGLSVLIVFALLKLLSRNLKNIVHKNKSINDNKNKKIDQCCNYCRFKSRGKEMDSYFKNYKKIFEQNSYTKSLIENDNYYETFDHIYGNIDKRPIEEMLDFLDSSQDNENKVVLFTFGYKKEEGSKAIDFLNTKNYSFYMRDIRFEEFLDRFLQRKFNRNTNNENIYDSLVNLFKYLLVYPKKICFVSKKGKEKYIFSKIINKDDFTFDFNYFYKLLSESVCQKDKHKLLHFQLEETTKKTTIIDVLKAVFGK